MTQEEQKIREWTYTLFREDEHTCMGDMYENRVFPVEDIQKTHEYVSINPMKKGTTRKGVNITAFRNFLFEMDGLNKNEQVDRIKTSGIPYSTVVDSGNKSLHWILALEEDLGDRAMYTAYFKAINSVLKKYGAEIDDACKDPGRFTRAPFGVNTKKSVMEQKPEIHKRVQMPGKIKGRQTIAKLDEWLEQNGVNPMDFIEVPVVYSETRGATSDADIALKFEWIDKYILKNHPPYEAGNYNYQLAMAAGLMRAGCTEGDIEHFFMQKWNHIHENGPIKGAREMVKPNETIYVPTMEERREYYRQQDEEMMRQHFRAGYERPNVDLKTIEARPENINRFILVGTEYFKLDSLSDELIPWNKTIFEKMYGTRAIPPLEYDKFGYKPDYISDPFPYHLEVDQKTRNKFIRPTYKITPGKWDTIEGALRHGFGDQYEMILQYCAISIAFPEAKLPALYFLGPEDKGKTAVVYVFKALVGKHNVRKISSKQLESDYTDFLAASQLVIVEETGGWKDPAGTMNNLKDWITDVGTQTCNPKYGKQFESPIHCKFIFTSNDWSGIPLTGSATRFWIREINEKPQNVVSNYYQQVDMEMGHFVDYLIREVVPQIKRNEEGGIDTTNRLYFSPDEYETSTKGFVKSLHRGPAYEGIMDAVSEFFEKNPDETECYFDLKSIKEANNWKFKGDPSNTEIKLCLKQDFGIEPGTRLKRRDSLAKNEYGQNAEANFRFTNWYVLTRDTVIGDKIFDMDLVS